MSDEDREKKQTREMKNKFFFLSTIAFDFQLNCRVFNRKIDILRPLKNVRTKNKKASAKLDFSNVLSFVRYDHQWDEHCCVKLADSGVRAALSLLLLLSVAGSILERGRREKSRLKKIEVRFCG